MTPEQLKEFLSWNITLAFRIITPWKMRDLEEGGINNIHNDYTRGWNDCLKLIKKNRKNYLKKFEELSEKGLKANQ